MKKIEVIYLKELSNIDEIVVTKHSFLKLIKIFYKKIVGNICIKDNGIAIIPYRKLNKLKIHIIKKVLQKLNVQVVLSKNLNKVEELKKELIESNINVIDGNSLGNYLYMPIVQYICKVKKEDAFKQEITILVNRYNRIIEEQIIEFVTKVKRINIVTPNLKQFEKLEEKLNNIIGMPCQITNNKRKSLLKANNIINFDFDEETLNKYNINRNAIIININNKVEINSKLFNGINVKNFDITYNNVFSDIQYNCFDKKALYESTIINKSYSKINEQIKKDNVKIVNLIGKNGIINVKEFVEIKK